MDEIKVGTKVLALHYDKTPFISGKVVALTKTHAKVSQGFFGYSTWWDLDRLEIVTN